MIFELVRENLSILGINKAPLIGLFRVRMLIGGVLLGTHVSFRLTFLFNEANSFQQYAESIFMSSGMVVISWCYASLIYKREELFEFIDKCDGILIQCEESLIEEYPKAVAEILKVAYLVEQCSKIIYFMVAEATTVCCLLPKFFYCMYCYYIKDLGRGSFELADRTMWYPFDWKNPMGHTYAVALQVTLTSYALFIVANTLSFGIGCYLFGITVTKEIKGILQTADKKLSLKTEQSTAMKRFSELVKWHSFIKQLITDFSSLFQPFFISVFMWSTLGICIIMLMVQLQIDEIKLVMFVMLFFNSCYAFGLLCVICELCQQVCDGFEQMNQTMDQLYWPLYPVDLQRLLTIIFIFAQQPVQFKVFGSIACCRDSFKKVVKSSFSYFMVVRRFY